MKVTKELKELLRAEYQKEWSTPKMVDYCTNRAVTLAMLDDGAILPIEKREIEKHFCYGEDGGESYRIAQEEARRARTDKDYFRRENMEYFNSWIKDLKEQRDFFRDGGTEAPHWLTLIGKHKKSRIAYMRNETLSNIIGFMGGSCYLHKLPSETLDIYGVSYRVPSVADFDKIIQALEEAAASHEKRVNTYLKKYGLSKVRSWTYWTMAEDAAPYQAENEKRYSISYKDTSGATYNVTPCGEIAPLLNWIMRNDDVAEFTDIHEIKNAGAELDRITTTFVLDTPLMVDVVENREEKTFEAWLYDDTCSFKMLMYGAGNSDGLTAAEIFELHANNFSGYQEQYLEDLETLERAAEARFYR